MRQTTLDMLVVGAGPVGRALATLAGRNGWRTAVASSRDLSEACQLGPQAGLCLIATSDDAIVPVCAALAGAGAFRPGAVVAHCSGALESAALAPARQGAQCALGSLHPLQTFPNVEAALERLPGAWCFCEGDAPAVALLRRLGQAMGCQVAIIAPGGKALYHAAAVMACNYQATLLEAALALAEAGGVDRATASAALAPLIMATAHNVTSQGPQKALTGPIARGDARTVALHMDRLKITARSGEISGDVVRLYRLMGQMTTALARTGARISDAQAQALTAVLAGPEGTDRSGPEICG